MLGESLCVTVLFNVRLLLCTQSLQACHLLIRVYSVIIIVIIIIYITYLLPVIEFSLGASSPYTNTDKTNNIHKRNNTKHNTNNTKHNTNNTKHSTNNTKDSKGAIKRNQLYIRQIQSTSINSSDDKCRQCSSYGIICSAVFNSEHDCQGMSHHLCWICDAYYFRKYFI